MGLDRDADSYLPPERLRVHEAVIDLENALADFEARCLSAGAYMPALATRLRIHADALADRYPDDTNGGRALAPQGGQE